MLAAALSLFMIFSFTGVAALNMANYTSLETQDAVHSMKNQYALESAISQALWRVTAVGDTSTNFVSGEVSISIDTNKHEMRAGIFRYDQGQEVTISLKNDHPFNHSLAATEDIRLNGYTVSSDMDERLYRELPTPDLAYLNTQAVAIHDESNVTFRNGDIPDGINIFTGDNITFENVSVVGTLVFTGTDISFRKNFTIIADTSNGASALVFTNPATDVFFYELNAGSSLTVLGAVVSEGRVWLRDGEFTGPVIARFIDVQNDFDFRNPDSPKYYNWFRTFGQESDYNWPKKAHRWQRRIWS